MKKYFILVLLVAGTCCSAAAQNKKKQYRFSSINNFLVLAGEDVTTGAFQSVNGFKKDKWFGGVGVGLDYYLYRTVPVFIDIRREFGSKKNKLFAYADAGINIESVQKDFYIQQDLWNLNYGNKFHNGIYTDAGIGFSIGLKNEHAFVMSLGHSVKTMKGTRWHSDWMTGKEESEIYKYSFSRIVLKIGWKF